MASPFFVKFAKDFTASSRQYVIIRYIINQSEMNYLVSIYFYTGNLSL